MNMKPYWPTRTDARLTSNYGWRTHPVTGQKDTHHDGIDLAPRVPGTIGVPVYAVADGIVRVANYNHTSGNNIHIEHTQDAYTSVYLHLARLSTGVGKKVKRGDIIGIMGATGRVTGVHLHFGVSIEYPVRWGANGTFISPLPYLEQPFQKVTGSTGIDHFARAIIAGKHGNGHANRKQQIYALIRSRVNQKATGRAKGSLPYDDIVAKVIQGDYGNGHEKRATAIYADIRNRVNQLV